MILEYAGLRIRVDCADAASLIWLQEFLAPAFTVRDSGQATCSVEMLSDNDAYRRTLQCGPQPNDEHAGCFAFDDGPVRLPWWTADGGQRRIWDNEAKAFYALDRDRLGVRVLIDRFRPSRRIGLMRVVREFAISHSWSGSSVVLHGASLAIGATGIVIVGAKGSGKTTLLTYLLLHAGGTAFVSNDRVVMAVDAAHTVLRAMPTVVQMHEPTVGLVPGVRGRLRREWDHRLSLHETPTTREDDAAHQSHQLTPAQFSRLVAAPMRGSTRGDVVMFPRIDDRRDGITIEPISPALAAARLRQHLLGGSSPVVSEVFAAPTDAIEGNGLDGVCRDLAARLRGYDCMLGRSAYQPDAAARIVAAIHQASTGERR